MREIGPGDVIAGRFELLRKAGAGAQGQLYAAIQHPLGREVAVKLVGGSNLEQSMEDQSARFRREAEALARLSHPCCVQVYDYGVWREQMYIVMELLQGVSMSQSLNGTPWPVERAVHVAFQIARGLSHAHAAGIVHRDLSPRNVMLLPEEEEHEGVRVKLVDFGLARVHEETTLTLPGQIMGTPSYLAPERLRGNPGTPAADVYAVGVMLHEMLTGRHPLRRRTPVATLVAVMEQGVPSLRDSPIAGRLPDGLIDLVDACTSPEPEERPKDGAALRKRMAVIRRHLEDRSETPDDESEITVQPFEEMTDPGPPELSLAPTMPLRRPLTASAPRPTGKTSHAPSPASSRAPPKIIYALLGSIVALFVAVGVLLLLRMLGGV